MHHTSTFLHSFIVLACLSCIACLGIGLLVRSQYKQSQSLWVDTLRRDSNMQQVKSSILKKNAKEAPIRLADKTQTKIIQEAPIRLADKIQTTKIIPQAEPPHTAAPGKVIIGIPTRPKGLCTHGKNLADLSINAQTVGASRIVVGISVASKPLEDDAVKCISDFRQMINVPLTISIKVTKFPSEGESRHAVFEAMQPDETVIFHDDDEYIHPQSVDLVSWLSGRYPSSDIFVMNYLYRWGITEKTKELNPWCLGERFQELYTTTSLKPKNKKDLKGLDITDPNAPEECRCIVHGYPIVRQKSLRFGIKYDHIANGADSLFLGRMVNAGAEVHYVCFPLMAYRSKLAQKSKLTKSAAKCPCFSGFSTCSGGCGKTKDWKSYTA